MAWIKVDQSLPTHRKTLVLADILGIDPVQAVGHLACLWLWSVDNASPGGYLQGVSPRILSRSAQWSGDATAFMDALIQAGFLDRTEGGLAIHRWDDHIGRLITSREKTRERVRAYRQRLRERGATAEQDSADRNAHVTRTLRARNAYVTRGVTGTLRERNGSVTRNVPVTLPNGSAHGDAPSQSDSSPTAANEGDIIQALEAEVIPGSTPAERNDDVTGTLRERNGDVTRYITRTLRERNGDVQETFAVASSGASEGGDEGAECNHAVLVAQGVQVEQAKGGQAVGGGAESIYVNTPPPSPPFPPSSPTPLSPPLPPTPPTHLLKSESRGEVWRGPKSGPEGRGAVRAARQDQSADDATEDERRVLLALWEIPSWPSDPEYDLRTVRELLSSYPGLDLVTEARKMEAWWRPKDLAAERHTPDGKAVRRNWHMRLRNWAQKAATLSRSKAPSAPPASQEATEYYKDGVVLDVTRYRLEMERRQRIAAEAWRRAAAQAAQAEGKMVRT